MKKIELLSPAGDLERLKLTLLYGADAVYIGGMEYSLRANATNFSIEQIGNTAHPPKKTYCLIRNENEELVSYKHLNLLPSTCFCYLCVVKRQH